MADWQRARLIPTSSVGSAKEAEVRATSAFLAVLSIVRPLSKTLLDPVGASRAKTAVVEAFIEPPFKTPAKVSRPDGMIRVTHGSKPPWTALLEVKTGNATLDAEQLNTYWDIARDHGFDAVISISNELQPAPGTHPTEGLKVRSNSKVKIHHWSWFMIRSLAAVERDHRGVDDPEQAWLLNELLRYLEHPSSGALDFSDMGQHWVSVRDAARDGSLSRRDDGVTDMALRWDQLLRYLSLRVSTETGAAVEHVLPRTHRDNRTKRSTDLIDDLCNTGVLNGDIRVPNTVDDIALSADIRAQRISAAVQVRAPHDRGNKARASWLMRQLSKAPESVVVEVWQKGARTPAVASTVGQAREDSSVLHAGATDIARFRLVLNTEMGRGRRAGGRSPSFVEALERLLFDMYTNVVQPIRPWVQAPPKIENGRTAAIAEVPVTLSASEPESESVDEPPPPVSPQWPVQNGHHEPDRRGIGVRAQGDLGVAPELEVDVRTE